MTPPEPLKPIYVKLSPGTDLYAKVTKIAQTIGVTPTKAARYMMRNGWLGFKRYIEREGFEVQE